MGDRSGIEWTDATWNPVVGCTRVSAGCDHCYAFQLHDQRHVAWKRGRWPDAPPQYHLPFSRVQLLPSRLDQPLRWQRPRRIFVNSLSDLFHDQVPDDFIDRVFAVMAAAGRHTFQVLTKRPERMRAYLSAPDRDEAISDAGYGLHVRIAPEHRVAFGRGRVPGGLPLPNVWLGVSVEDQRAADERIPLLLETPAAVRFLSCEPLLGPVDLLPWLDNIFQVEDASGAASGAWCRMNDFDQPIHWVIVGGESGPHARPMHPDWARRLRDQCTTAGVAYFFKQWGDWLAADQGGQRFIERGWLAPDDRLHQCHRFQDGAAAWRVGKHAAGRLLDGRAWDEVPEGGAEETPARAAVGGVA